MLKQLLPRLPFKKIIQGARLVGRAFTGYKRHFVLLTVLGFAAGLFEAVGVSLLIPLFSFFVGDKTSGSDDVVTRVIERAFESVDLGVSLPVLLVFIIFLFFLKAGVQLLFNYVRLRITTGYSEHTKHEMFENILKASWPYLAKQRLGHLDTIMKVDTERSAEILSQLANLVMVMTGTLMYMLVAFNISETMTLMTVVAGIVIFFILKPLFFHVRQAARETAKKYQEVAHIVNESISGIKAIKIDGIEESVAKRAGVLFSRQRYLKMRSGMLKQMATICIEPAMVVFIAGIVVFAFYQTAFNLGAIAAVVYLIQRTFNYIKQAQGVLHKLNEAIPYLQNMLQYHDEARRNQEDIGRVNGKPFSFSGSIVFDNIEFTYPDGERAILKNFSCEVKRGSLVGIVGPSGVGKTTVFDLLSRLQEPTRGCIVVDGTDVRNIDLHDWRKHMAYVSQDSFLLNDTVANNIRFFAKDVTDEEIKVAARKAHIHELIETKLSRGYDTVLGGDGVQLSGGERQRVAIARALVRDPDILLLDEATSALDTATENEIQKAIEDLHGEITIFVIAHRLSTIEHVDILLTLKDGNLVVEEK